MIFLYTQRHSAMAPLSKLTGEVWKKKIEASKQERREDLINQQYHCGEMPVYYPKEGNNYNPTFNLKVQEWRCKVERVKEVVCRFDKKLVAERYRCMHLTLMEIKDMEGWMENAVVRRVMDLDGFDHKIQLFKTQKVDGEAVQGVMGA